MNDERLADLLLEWEEARDRGHPLTPEQLCRACPELLGPLKKQIATLQAIDPLLRMTRERNPTLLVGVTPQTGGELRELLHTKLRLAAALLLGVLLVSLLTLHLSAVYAETLTWLDWGSVLAASAVTGLCLLLLQLLPHLSLRWLRGVETTIFGVAMLLMMWAQHSWLHRGWFEGIAAPGQQHKVMVLAADSFALPWFFLIVLYGTFIPGSWQRCTAVVGMMCLVAVAPVVIHAFNDRELGPYLWRDTLLPLSLGLGMGAAIAIYGSHKINLLQTEAFVARKLGQYRLKRRLGSGGMGEVFLAEHQLLRRPCAIKVIRPERASEERTIKRFEREVQVLATLTHPNTVEIYDYGRGARGVFYYVMEYLPGWTLEQIVEKHGPLAPERVIHLLRQVCGALQEAHSRGLIHRDIKPSNIIVCERGGIADVAKLVDFGLVKDLKSTNPSRLTMEGVIAGTPLYLSPEQAAVSRQLDQRSDLASLGSVAYFLLCGRPPFVRDTTMQLFAAHINDPVEPLQLLRSDVPKDLEAVVMKCLEKEPARRYPDARTLERALASCACANLWTPERAELWWQTHGAEALDTGANAASTEAEFRESKRSESPRRSRGQSRKG